MICDYEALKVLIGELLPKESFWQSQLFGIIIGGIIGAFSSVLTNYFQSKREDKIHLRRKRENTYLRMLNILHLLRNEAFIPNNKNVSQKRKKEIDECFAPINVYASESIKNMYIKTAKQIDLFFMKNCQDIKALGCVLDLINEFIKLIRKELGVMD